VSSMEVLVEVVEWMELSLCWVREVFCLALLMGGWRPRQIKDLRTAPFRSNSCSIVIESVSCNLSRKAFLIVWSCLPSFAPSSGSIIKKSLV
jgi:hypothetical protein